MSATPTTLLAQQLAFLDRQLPGVRDGSADAIHDARVASRRVRELLPLCDHDSGAGEDLRRAIRNVGRALGRVRDLDVQIALLDELERRVPRAGSLLALLRDRSGAAKQRRLRKLLKQLPDRLTPRARLLLVRSSRHLLHERVWPASWRQALRERVIDRRETAQGALARATGVYFPNRLHEARIAIKKLRYATELGVATGVVSVANSSIRRLRKAQDALGNIHDWQLLLELLEEEGTAAGDGRDTAITLLRSDIQSRHRRFLERRGELVDACHSIQPHRARITTARALPVASAVALAIWSLSQGRR